MFCASRQVQRERAVVAETVQGPSAGQAAQQYTVLALIQEGAGLLAGPGRRRVTDPVLVDDDLAGYVAMQEYRLTRQAFTRSQQDIVARQHSLGAGETNECLDD